MFKQTKQVQTIDVNEWVNKLLDAHDDVTAVKKITERLDKYCSNYIGEKAANLNSRTSLYDWYYEEMPYMDGFMKDVAEIIGYKLPDNLAEMWQGVVIRYYNLKGEEGKGE